MGGEGAKGRDERIVNKSGVEVEAWRWLGAEVEAWRNWNIQRNRESPRSVREGSGRKIQGYFYKSGEEAEGRPRRTGGRGGGGGA